MITTANVAPYIKPLGMIRRVEPNEVYLVGKKKKKKKKKGFLVPLKRRG